MEIRFLCPNGHKIHCADDRAGKPAKCPKCNVRFRIPEISELLESGIAEAKRGEVALEGGQAEARAGSPAEEEQMEFLCPSGHRLHGPRSQQGEPGQCPECGVRFLVPACDQIPDGQDQISHALDGVGPEIKLLSTDGGPVPDHQSDHWSSALGEDDEAPHDAAEAEENTVGMPRVVEIPTSAQADDSGRLHLAATAHPLADLVAELWPERARGAMIELYLSDGHTIVPDGFAQGASQGGFGVFASSDPDGTHTLTAVAWESVLRVVVRGLGQLPYEFRS